MPICAVCNGIHNLGECPKQQRNSIEHLFKTAEPEADPKEFQAIRVKHINRTTGLEDNFIPSYYQPSKNVLRLTSSQIEDIRYQNEIEVEGRDVPAPITSFQESGLSPDIVQHLERQGFVEPTPIQMQSLPCLLSGRDVVGMAATGSGKTLCYILPMVMFLRSKPPTGPGEGPLAIILAPNRELVEQIYSEAIKLMPQVGMSYKATADIAVPHAPPTPATLPPQARVPSSSSANLSALASKMKLEKQKLQIKQQQATQQLQIQQMQLAHQQEIQQTQEQQAYQASQYTPEQQQEYNFTQYYADQLAQLAAHHQSQIEELQAEHAKQTQQLLAEHAQEQLALQQKQQQKEAEQAAQDYSLYSKAAPNGNYDYSNYNYATASKYYTQHGASAQEYDYSQPQFTPPPVNLPPALPRKVLGVCGGVPIQIQITPLQMGVDVLVSTPGRLIDLIHKGVCKLDRVSFMVFDEADRMLAPEMELQLRNIVTQCSVCARQSVLFSATFPPAVERLVRSAVLNPIYVHVGEGNKAAETIIQQVIFVHSGEKRAKLLEVLRETPKPPVLIFSNSHSTVEYLVRILREEQFHAAGIHSDKNQAYRFRVMKAFKDGALDILVATDVVSRGIDVPDVALVLQYDLPDRIEDYTHRIGRTGRAGKEGRAVSFLGLECKIADDLRRLLRQARQPIPPELQNTKQFGGEIVRGELRDYVKKR